MDGEVDAPISEPAEALEVGDEQFAFGEFLGTEVAGTTVHAVGVADLLDPRHLLTAVSERMGLPNRGT